MSNKIYFIAVDDLAESYRGFHADMNKKYGIEDRLTDRVLYEVIMMHVTGVLNSRTYSMYNPVIDTWEMGLIDVLFNNQLSDVSHVLAGFNDEFKSICREVSVMLNPFMNENNPHFTIWEVNRNGGDILSIEVLGDYRIEQWHSDYNVSKSMHGDIVTVDLDMLTGYIKQRVAYNTLPSTIDRLYKKDVIDKFIMNLVGFCLAGKSSDKERSLKYLDILMLNDMGTVDMFDNFVRYFEYEIKPSIEQLSNNSTISSYVITGTTVVLYYDPNLRGSRISRGRLLENELALADSNMDYIPERQRRYR